MMSSCINLHRQCLTVSYSLLGALSCVYNAVLNYSYFSRNVIKSGNQLEL